MITSGAVNALVVALGVEGVAEEAAGALALIVRQPMGAETVGNEETVVAGLVGVVRCGSPRGKENALAALLELCRSGGAATTERVVRAPTLGGLIQSLLFTGTKRARRKAASLARVFQRCENNYNASLHVGPLGMGYAFAGNSATNRDTSSLVMFRCRCPCPCPCPCPCQFKFYRGNSHFCLLPSHYIMLPILLLHSQIHSFMYKA